MKVLSTFRHQDPNYVGELHYITFDYNSGSSFIWSKAATVTRSSSFTKPGFKNQTAPEQTITRNDQMGSLPWNITYIKIQHFSVCYFKKKTEPLNQLRLFMDQFVRYIHGKVCSYRVFNILA